MEDRPNLPYGGSSGFPRTPNTSPTPHHWTPKYIPDSLIYTYGFDIKENHRLGAAVAHIPTRTTKYTDADGTHEANTIIREGLVAIFDTILTTFATPE
jgi:hypothetical protein